MPSMSYVLLGQADLYYALKRDEVKGRERERGEEWGEVEHLIVNIGRIACHDWTRLIVLRKDETQYKI